MTFPINSRPRVMIADDHPEVTKAICRLLALDCDVVGTVADGAAVLEAAQRLRPDVIVMDLNLPAVSGLEACRRVTQENPGARIIMFTATDDPNLRRRAFEVGASAFLCKVSTDTDLLSAIQCLCEASSAPAQSGPVPT